MRSGRTLSTPLGLALAAFAAFSLLSSACATYQTELNQGIRYYESNEHEKSLAIFRMLEPDIDSLKSDDRARYYYFRGMTDYRLNNEKYDVSADARHWLGLAAVSEADFPNSLTNKQISLLCEAVGQLNKKAYNQAASDAPVVEFKICKDKSVDDGVTKEAPDKEDEKGDSKKDDDKKGDEKPKKKKPADE